MNFYINKYSALLINCRTEAQFEAFYERCSRNIASIILGRNFSEELEDYLERKPAYKEFFHWWRIVRDSVFERPHYGQQVN